MNRFIVLAGFSLAFLMTSCNRGVDKSAIATDSATIERGEQAFIEKCSGCHNFKMDGMGPQLGGVTNEVSVDWLQHFIHDPKATIESGDKRAKELFDKFQAVMPSFASMTADELNGIISFLNTHQVKVEVKFDSTAIADPIPAKIQVSNLVLSLSQIVQVPASIDSGKKPQARITQMVLQPGGQDLFILDLRGKFYRLANQKLSVYVDMASLRPKFIHQPGLATGFGSFAFHPEFKKNGLVYTTHTEAANSARADFNFEDSIKPAMQWVLTEWKTEHPESATFSGTGREILRIDVPTGIHGVQEIIFNPYSKPGDEDYGLLYVGIGDGGSVENGWGHLAHSREKIWGTVIRIDPLGRNSKNGKYGIPAGNPFVKSGGQSVLKEIYAYGFRNPHRITWTKAGQMLVSNVGHSNIESLNLIQPGHDYGWPIREGNFLLNPFADIRKVHPLPPDDSMYHVNYPVAEFDHDEGKAITGGYEYLGEAVPGLKGKFVFGDIPSGRLFYVNVADITQGKQAPIMEWKLTVNGVQKTLIELCGDKRVDLHFGRDSKGEIYIMTKADGKVYKVIK